MKLSAQKMKILIKHIQIQAQKCGRVKPRSDIPGKISKVLNSKQS